MGLAERVLTRESATEERAMQVTPWGDWGTSFASTAGMNVTTDSALQLLTVYGATALIADTIATLPRDVFRAAGGKNLEVPNRPRWLEQPNPTTDIVEFLTQTLLDLLLDGNAYWAYKVDLNFLPTTLTVISPTVMDVRDEDGATVYYVNGERFRGRLVHIKGITRSGLLKGMSPVEAARQGLGLGLAQQEYSGNFYKNGAVLSAVVEVPGAMTQKQAKDLRENISRTHGGVGNAHLPGVITNGGKWNQISVTPEQAEFLASRKYSDGAICSQMFLLDPTMLGIPVETGQNLTYANLEQRGIHLVQFTLMRWIIRLERAFTFLLPKPQFLKFNVNALQRADLKTRYEAHRIALGPTQPFEAVNEVRAFEDMPPMSGMDQIAEPQTPSPSPPPPQPPQQNHITVEAAQIHVPQQPAPIVQVAAAEVPAPIVNVERAEAPVVNVNVEPTPIEMSVEPTPLEVNVAAPEVNVTQPEVNVNVAPPENRIEVNPTPIEVNVAAPEPAQVTIEPQEITVNQAPITVEPAPLTVNPTPIRIDAPVVNMPKPGKIRRTFERDDQGVTVAVIEEPIEDEAPTEGTEHESQ